MNIEALIGTVALATGVFAATNIDDIFVLLAMFSDPRYNPRQITAGQYLGMAALFGASLVGSLASFVMQPAYIGLLGLAPILIGTVKLLRRRQADYPETNTSSSSNVLSVAVITAANGGDNLGIYTPMFAIRSAADIAMFAGVFAVMTAVWVGFAHWLTRHPKLGPPIRDYGQRAVPFVLIGLGVYVLIKAGSFSLFR